MPFQRKKPAKIGEKRKYPGFIEPALAMLVERVPSGKRWVHEIKFDGYRVQVHLINAEIKVFTRRGNDWTKRFRKIANDVWQVSASSAMVDGEVVVPAADGTTDFSALQNELKGRSTSIVLVAFDLIYLNGYDLRKIPLFERKDHLKKPIAGFALDGNKWDGIFVGRRKGKELLYAGKVDHGFDDESSKILRALLKPLIRPTQPYTKKVAHRGVWVEPELLAEIEHRAKSAEGKLRHPVYKGLRKDL